jgi:hypothetical protein
LAYQDPFDVKWASSGDVFPLTHAKDENIIFIYYFQQSINSTKPTRQMRGKILKIKAGDQVNLTVRPEDFRDFGDPQGSPLWK